MIIYFVKYLLIPSAKNETIILGLVRVHKLAFFLLFQEPTKSQSTYKHRSQDSKNVHGAMASRVKKDGFLQISEFPRLGNCVYLCVCVHECVCCMFNIYYIKFYYLQ